MGPRKEIREIRQEPSISGNTTKTLGTKVRRRPIDDVSVVFRMSRGNPSRFSLQACRPTTPCLGLHTSFAKDRHHRTPVCEGRLEQVQTHEGSEQIPIRTHPIP